MQNHVHVTGINAFNKLMYENVKFLTHQHLSLPSLFKLSSVLQKTKNKITQIYDKT